MSKHRLFLAAVCSLGMLAINPLVTEARGASGHGGGGHGGGGGGHVGGGHVGGGAVGHAGGAHMSGGHVGGSYVARGGGYYNGARAGVGVGRVRGGQFANGGRGLNYGGLGYYNRGGRDFDRRGYYGGYYGGGYPFGYGYGWGGYGGHPYYDNYYNSYYDAPTYVAPSYDYADPGYSSYSSPSYVSPGYADSAYAPPANDFADPLQAPLAAPAPLNNTAEVDVLLPQPDAQIWVNNNSMPSNSSTRRNFVSPALQPGRAYSYRISAAWMENGQPVRVDRTVSVTAGRVSTVDFTSGRMMPRADD